MDKKALIELAVIFCEYNPKVEVTIHEVPEEFVPAGFKRISSTDGSDVHFMRMFESGSVLTINTLPF